MLRFIIYFHYLLRKIIMIQFYNSFKLYESILEVDNLIVFIEIYDFEK